MVMLPMGWTFPPLDNVENDTTMSSLSAQDMASWVKGQRIFSKALYYADYPQSTDVIMGYTVFLQRLKSGNFLLQDFYVSDAKYTDPYQVEAFHQEDNILFRQDVLTGELVCYTQEGVKFSQVQFQKGLQHGLETIWYSNGQKAAQGRYHEGQPVGTHYIWREDGELEEAVNYGDAVSF